LGAAFVALLLIAAEPTFQSGAASESRRVGEPLILNTFGVQVSATSESRVGEAPILAGANSQAFVAEILIPRLGLELRRPDLIFQLFYAVRFYWENPNPDSTPDPMTGLERSQWAPLILHTAGLSLDTRASRRVSLAATATGSIGSPDYTTLPQILGTVQASLPPIVDVAAVDTEVRGGFRATRRWTLNLTGHLSYWHWLDAPPASTPTTMGQTMVAGQIFMTGQTLVTVTPEAEIVLTARDWLGIGAALGATSYSDGAGISTATPEVTWRTRVSPRTNFRLTGGVTYAKALGTTPQGTQPLLGASGSTVAPIGSFELFSSLMRHDQILVQGGVTGAVDFYVDPVFDSAVSRASVGGRLTLISSPLWMATLRGDFGTALRDTPYQTIFNGALVPNAVPPDETAFSVGLSARRWMSENLLAEVGGIWADRAPALVTPDFKFHQRQLWIYVALTATTRPIARLAH